MDIGNMSQEELVKLAHEKGIELTDEQLDSIAGGAWESEKEYTVTHVWVNEGPGDRGCGQTFVTKERYIEYCPICNAYIGWHAPEA